MNFSLIDQGIGVFDSGVGGLTVLKELMQKLPKENFIYLGDTAHLPYGEKSQESIIRYSIDNTLFLIKKNVKMIVIACNTASAYALEELQQTFSLPVIGVIEGAVACALEVSKKKRIAILGTKGTIRSQAYQKAILSKNPKAFLLPIACPLFVPIVEERYVDHLAAQLIVQEYLKPLKS